MPRNWAWGKKRKSGYRSGLEEKVAEKLAAKDVPFEYEKLKLFYNKKVLKGLCLGCGVKTVVQVRSYTPDFTLPNGVVIEVKGRLTPPDRTKLIAVKEANPDIKLVLYFGADNKLSKKSETRYGEWAASKEFDFAIDSIPRRWLKGIARSGAGLERGSKE